MEKTLEGAGIVQLGEVNSFGRWEVSEGQLLISFEMHSLSHDHNLRLEQYRNSSKPLPVRLPGQSKASGVVLGFERDRKVARFFVACEQALPR